MTVPLLQAFRHRVIVEAEATTRDELGGRAAEWVAVAETWAAIEPLGVRERVSSGRVEGLATHRVTVRQRAGIAAGMRFRLGERVLRILALHDPEERGRFLACLTEEGGE